ncbi:hypothetical protein A9Q86_07730 [Flavobacteriales bacterium 33_180_T64]|nr:hypothetical protein A9Q86_07730 [Flavobacteriales bacterium 33_180_T64]
MKLNNYILSFLTCLLVSCYTHEQKPKDFDEFWQKTLTELGTEFKSVVIRDSIVENKKWTLHKIESFQGVNFKAWVSEPLEGQKYPVKIKFSGFGRVNANSNEIPHKWFLKEEKSINMVIDVREQGISREGEMVKGFLTKGLENRNDYIYRGAFMDAVRSVDFIAEHPKSDGNIIVTGGSQGGALSIVATALNPKVTMSIIGFPFYTDLYNYDKQKWPMKILIRKTKTTDTGLDELYHTLSYFDMLNFADKIDTPLFLRTQKLDTITPKEGAIKFFNAIKSTKKELYIEPCEGHGCSSQSKEANKLERAFIKAHRLSN